MDNRPIGVFDSGLGGLTAVKELQLALPGEDIIYFGDTGRVPYGTRSRETIIKYARQDIRFLRSFDTKAIVVACGTVSTAALPALESEGETRLIGIVRPAVWKAVRVTRNGNVGLIATPASVRSRGYEREMSAAAPEVQLFCDACPLLVPLVENGRIGQDDPVTRLVLEEYLNPMRERGIDTLILGCTHYPLLSDAIHAVLPNVTLVNAGAEVAAFMARSADWERAEPGREGTVRYYVSDNPEGFARISELFLEKPIVHTVGLVDMDAIL